MIRSNSLPYIVPFGAFLGYLAIRQLLGLPDLWEQILCVALMSAILAGFSRRVIDFRVRSLFGTIAIGAGVFALWVAPDTLFPHYREHWLFSNSLVGSPQGGLGDSARRDGVVLLLRALRASIIVPILEELFWRAWLMRWIVDPDFEKVPLGNYAPKAFWIVAILFASEHGSYWEVGLIAGLIYNWWMVRTKSLGDLILAHGITNALLSAYVVWGEHWQYWA